VQLAAFSSPRVQTALKKARVRLVFVGSGSPSQAKQFVDSLKFPHGLPGEMLLDPATTAYGCFNLQKSVYASLVPSIVHGMRTHGIGAVSEGIRLGWKNAALAGDSWQQGGTFVLESSGGKYGNVSFAQAERWPGDWLPMEQVLAAAGAQLEQDGTGPQGACSVDYAAALRWYMALPPLARSKVPSGSLTKRLTVVAAGAVACACLVLLLLPALGLLNWGLQETQQSELR
jgi:hypothetical protein